METITNTEKECVMLNKPPRYRWIFLVLNCLGITFFFMVVQLFSSFSNEAMESLDISYTTYGFISTTSYFSYGIFLLIGGPLGTKIGTKKLALLGLPFAIIAHVFWPFCDSVALFIVLRFIGGISGGLYVGWLLSATAVWFPAKERALAGGILTGCIGLGYSVDSFFANILLNAGFEWRTAGMLMIVVTGIVLMILYAAIAKDFRDVYKGYTIVDEILPGGSKQSDTYKEDGLTLDKLPTTLAKSIKSPMFVFLSLVIMMNCGTVYTVASYLPLLLEVDLGFGAETVASILVVTFLAMLISSPIGGVISDRFMGQKRSYALIIGFVITLITCMYIPYAPMAVLPLILFLFYGGIPFMNGPYWALPEEVFNPKFGGTISSVLLFMGVFAGTVSQPLLGALVDYTGSNISTLYVYMVFSAIGTIAAIFVLRKEKKFHEIDK